MVHTPDLRQFSGHQYFRQRLALSILSGKAVKIDKIRSDDKDPGLRGEFPNTRVTELIG
jgi:RNA 3'-terminal phosphate cyclase-like protein